MLIKVVILFNLVFMFFYSIIVVNLTTGTVCENKINKVEDMTINFNI